MPAGLYNLPGAAVIRVVVHMLDVAFEPFLVKDFEIDACMDCVQVNMDAHIKPLMMIFFMNESDGWLYVVPVLAKDLVDEFVSQHINKKVCWQVGVYRKR